MFDVSKVALQENSLLKTGSTEFTGGLGGTVRIFSSIVAGRDQYQRPERLRPSCKLRTHLVTPALL
jgi:hypothetical protein